MKEFWSGRIRSLTPYTPGEQPKERKFIKLNTNENPYPPSPKVVEAVQKGVDERLKLYPDPDASKLVSALAQSYGVKESQVFVGNGSDEVLAFAFQAFFEEGGTVLFPDITYSFYPVYCNMLGIHYRTVPLQDDFTIPVEKMLGDNDGVVITNPNAPTGIELDQTSLRRILEGNPDVGVIVDEAYIDFGGTSALPLLDEYPNLLVVQTMSKSRALAGMRVGFAFGSENLIQGLNCVKNSINSYTIDQLAILPSAVPRWRPPETGRRRPCGSWALPSCPPRATLFLSPIRNDLPASSLRICVRRAFWFAILTCPESTTSSG